MADINHQITLGIGTPGTIPQFLTLGLFIGSIGLIEGSLYDRDHLAATLPARDFGSGTLYDRPVSVRLEDR